MKIPQAFSIYLDLVRAVCAIAVVFHHYNTQIVRSPEHVFPDVGQEAVTLFFVLSGFVIAHVARNRERSLVVFTAKRLARIYPVAIAGVVLSYISYAVFSPSNPALYERYVSDHPWWREVVLTLSFLNQTYWLPQLTPPTNSVYWSLTCEIWFYVLAGFIFFARMRWTLIAIVVAVPVLGPKIMLLFPAWLAGVGAQRLCDRIRLSRAHAVAIAVSSGMIGLALWTSGVRFEWRLPGDLVRSWRLGLVSDFIYYDTLALVAGIHFIAAYNFFARPFRWPTPISRCVRYAAESSFSLYAMHFPVLLALRTSLPQEPFPYFYPVITVGILLVCGRPIEHLRIPAYRLLSALGERVRLAAGRAALADARSSEVPAPHR